MSRTFTVSGMVAGLAGIEGSGGKVPKCSDARFAPRGPPRRPVGGPRRRSSF
jgi:hypothetical protein